MDNQCGGTVGAILEAGKREFLRCGYEKASMRQIAGKAGVTTGAIYGYFPGKEALFEALTGETAEGLLHYYQEVHTRFGKLPAKEQTEQLMTVTDDNIPDMIDYIYDHFDTFKLLFCCGEAKNLENYLSRLTEVGEKSTRNFLEGMKSLGHTVPDMDDEMIHIFSRAFFQQIRELVDHDVPRERAKTYMLLIGRFQHAGWSGILGL